MPRRRKRKENHNQERWLITYSDLITLLMIFFVIMYAMSSVNQVKFSTLSKSLAEALQKSDQVPLSGMGSTSLLLSGAQNSGNHATQSRNQQTVKNDQSLENLYALVKQYIEQHNLQGNVTILDQQRGVQITLKDVVLFDTGQATIKPAAQTLLQGLVPFFRELPNPIVIEGYTDNQPIDTPQFPTNWELSSARAMGVVRFIAGQGVDPNRLSGVGYGQYHNIASNATDTGRQANRRVNIVILREGTDPGTYASQTDTGLNNVSDPFNTTSFTSGQSTTP